MSYIFNIHILHYFCNFNDFYSNKQLFYIYQNQGRSDLDRYYSVKCVKYAKVMQIKSGAQ